MNRYFLIVCFFFSLLALAVSVYCLMAERFAAPNVVYVDLNKMHADFKLTSELEQKFKSSSLKRSSILDSISFDLQLLQKSIVASPQKQELKDKYNSLAALYSQRNETFETDNQNQASEYDKQIWAQLNQYVQDYRKENPQYKLILGVSGNGSVMAADKSYDISEDVIKYVNKRYEGLVRNGNK